MATIRPAVLPLICAWPRLFRKLCPGGMLSAGICLLLRRLYAFDRAETIFAARLGLPPAHFLARISNHAVLSLDIAAQYSALIHFFKHVFGDADPLAA
jgi:hypothetical protein